MLVLAGSNLYAVISDVLNLHHGQLFVDAPTPIVAGTIEDITDQASSPFAYRFPQNPTKNKLDSARFHQPLADETQIHMKNVRAYILGEHQNSRLPATGFSDAGGEPTDPTPARYASLDEVEQQTFLRSADVMRQTVEKTRKTLIKQ